MIERATLAGNEHCTCLPLFRKRLFKIRKSGTAALQLQCVMTGEIISASFLIAADSGVVGAFHTNSKALLPSFPVASTSTSAPPSILLNSHRFLPLRCARWSVKTIHSIKRIEMAKRWNESQDRLPRTSASIYPFQTLLTVRKELHRWQLPFRHRSEVEEIRDYKGILLLLSSSFLLTSS